MSDIIKHSKKVLSYTLTVSTMVWSVGLFALTPISVGATAGDLIKAAGSPAVYQVDANGVTIHPIPHARVYHSWGFDPNYKTVITTDISGFTVGSDVEFRDGSLVRAQEKIDVYVKSAGKLLPVISGEVFKALGYNSKNVTWLPQTFIDKYTKGDVISSTTTHPDGTLVKYANSAQVYLIQGGQKKAFASTDVSKVNGYGGPKTLIPVITIPTSETYVDGAKIVVRESALTVPVGVGAAPVAGATPGGTTTPPPAGPVGSGLTVALASDNAAATTILADSDTNTYPQGQIPFLKVNFTAGADGAVKVTSLKFKRSGVSADSDLGNLYIYDGNTKLAEFTAFSDKVVTFSNSSGLFTVDAGKAKAITLKGDLARAATSIGSGKTVGFDLVAASDVVTDKATPSGNFPVAGALMSTAAVADLGHIYLSSYTTYPSTIKADAASQELWRFTANSVSQDMDLSYVKMTLVGTVAVTDIKDLKLEVGGVQVGTTQQINSDKTLVFDLAASPYKIIAGQNKVVVLRGSMAGGAGKTFKFTIQRQADIVASDRNYGVFNPVTITDDNDAFALIEPTTGNGTSVSSGSITSGVASDSPTGNVADGATAVTLAKFSFASSGEAVKVNSLGITAAIANNDGQADGNAGLILLNNVKLQLDGSQIGTTASTVGTSSTQTSYTFGNTFIIPAGETRYVTVVADLTHVAVETNDTIAITLALPASANAQGQTTLTSLTTTAQTARTLTVKGGVVAVSKNGAFGERSSTLPTGTANAKAAKIASFLITAGAGEASDVTQIVLKDASTVTQMGDNFQNLVIKNGETQIGETIGSLDTSATAATYTFTPSTAIRIAGGAQYTVDVYADIKSSPQDSATVLSPVILVNAISATGASTSSNTGLAAADINSGSGLSLQNGYISANGTLTVTAASDTPVAQQVVMGTTDATVAKFKLAASVDEDISISEVYVAATVSSGATSSWRNIKIYSQSGSATPAQVGSASEFSTTSTTTYAVVPFTSLALTVPKNSNVFLIVKADVNTAGNATSAGTATFALLPDYDGATTGNQEAITGKGASSGSSISGSSLAFSASPDAAVSGNAMTVYGTKITAAYASDAPSGASTPSAGATITKINITNTLNIGNYSATIKYMNFAISHSGASKAAATRLDLSVYKDSVVSTNLVATTSWGTPTTSNENVGTTVMANNSTTVSIGANNLLYGMNDVEIAPGETKTFVVVLDTNSLSFSASVAESLSIGVSAGGIVWRDGVLAADIVTVNSLPLQARTLTY